MDKNELFLLISVYVFSILSAGFSFFAFFNSARAVENTKSIEKKPDKLLKMLEEEDDED